MKITCLAVDDEPLALEKLKLFIGRFPVLQLEGTFTNPLKAMDYIRSRSVQLLFLDIQMTEMSGLS
ncbi:MAG TPA: response regulator, partial [Prolixibacteraceae bacterium]|nr:response regulator [Prolixibacteraceae bacterium]